jgi:hypothetical protein
LGVGRIAVIAVGCKNNESCLNLANAIKKKPDFLKKSGFFFIAFGGGDWI